MSSNKLTHLPAKALVQVFFWLQFPLLCICATSTNTSTTNETSSTYKLTYFPIKGRAEQIRFLLSYGGVEFIDNRIDSKEWPNIKNGTPFGQLPVLEINGEQICQSEAISRYLGKQFGLGGKDDLENLKIDVIVNTIDDVRAKISAHHYEDNAEIKAKKFEASKELVPFYIERLDKLVEKNGGYFVGGKLTWADLVFVSILDYLNAMQKCDIIEKAENLKTLKDKVLAIPQIKSWVGKRPWTEF